MDIKVTIRRSPKAKKKWRATFSNGKVVNFGASGYQNYTQHGNEEKRLRYIGRHAKREHWNNIMTAGFWSRWLLWEKPTIHEAARAIANKFKVSVLVAD
jgi:hypothetical protein